MINGLASSRKYRENKGMRYILERWRKVNE
jgi:hypothetical protein